MTRRWRGPVVLERQAPLRYLVGGRQEPSYAGCSDGSGEFVERGGEPRPMAAGLAAQVRIRIRPALFHGPPVMFAARSSLVSSPARPSAGCGHRSALFGVVPSAGEVLSHITRS